MLDITIYSRSRQRNWSLCLGFFQGIRHGQPPKTSFQTSQIQCRLLSYSIEEFRTRRQQKVVVEGEKSSLANVTSGVPQGSVIGPTMFLYYINDWPDNIKPVVRLFASDTVVYNTTDNQQCLQEDLDKLAIWETNSDKGFHPTKWLYMRFSQKRIPDTLPIKFYDTEIPRASTFKYLGVTLDPKIIWNTHIDHITHRANSTLGFISHNVLTTSQSVAAGQTCPGICLCCVELHHRHWNQAPWICPMVRYKFSLRRQEDQP